MKQRKKADRKKVDRPRLFIGSSKESLEHAYAIQRNLEDSTEPVVWDQGIFKLSKSSLENLIESLNQFDFAVFVLAPDDVLSLRNRKYQSVRDNVVFELGLFMGKIGRSRTFFVIPKGSEEIRIPTDLAGITPGEFDPKRKDKNLRAAFGPFCSEVRSEVQRLGSQVPPKTRSNSKHASRSRDEFTIIKAEYGIPDHKIDVTQRLNDLIGRLHINVGNELAGDPAPNIRKNLVVKYKYKRRKLEKTLDEGEDLDLP